MKITRTSRLLLGAQNITTVVLYLAALGLLAWLSARYTVQWDWTAGNRNTLAEASQRLLETLQGPVQITAFARENKLLRESISDLVGRYARYKSDLALDFVNPDTDPERVRRLGITLDGELVIEYRGRSEKLRELNEQALSNTLQRVVREEQRWIVFLSGHGERNPQGEANHDLGVFIRELEGKGLKTQRLNLSETPSIPENTSVLVIAAPQVNLLPGEVQLIRNYVDQGGNLLWLGDPGERHGLDPVAEALNVEFLPGTVVDATTQLFGIDDPAFALVTEYPSHAITRGFDGVTLFPQAAALEVKPSESWASAPFLKTLERSWTETGPIADEVRFDEGSEERQGPLTVGVAMERSLGSKTPTAEKSAGEKGKQQRIIITGDGDFLSNAFLGNGGNLGLGLKMVNWLSHDNRFIEIQAKTAVDRSLTLSKTATLAIGLGFLFLLPLALLGSGIGIWLVRRRR